MRLKFLTVAMLGAWLCNQGAVAQDAVLPTLETLQTVQAQFKTKLEDVPPVLPLAFVAAADPDYYDTPLGESEITLHAAALFSEQARPGLERVDPEQHQVLALWLQENADHTYVLELYMNLSIFGRNAFGVEEASLAYFGKTATQMRLDEMAYLALMVRAPNWFQLPDQAEQVRTRLDDVLGEMLKMGAISEGDRAMFIAGPLPVVLPVAD